MPAPASSAAENAQTRVLLVDCPDRPGLIHGITGVLLRHGANIVSNDEFADTGAQRFFMRSEFVGAQDHGRIVEELRAELPPPANVRIGRAGSHRIAVLVTTEHHCLGELLMRQAYDELGAAIVAVVSNHPTLEPLVRRSRHKQVQ